MVKVLLSASKKRVVLRLQGMQSLFVALSINALARWECGTFIVKTKLGFCVEAQKFGVRSCSVFFSSAKLVTYGTMGISPSHVKPLLILMLVSGGEDPYKFRGSGGPGVPIHFYMLHM